MDSGLEEGALGSDWEVWSHGGEGCNEQGTPRERILSQVMLHFITIKAKFTVDNLWNDAVAELSQNPCTNIELYCK